MVLSSKDRPVFLTDLEIEAIRLSLKVALWSVACSLPPALLVAFLLARGRFPGRVVLDAVAHLPLVIPPVAVGYGLLLLLGRKGPLGAWLHDTFGLSVIFTWRGAALAAAVMGFPLMVRAMRLSLEAVDRRLEAAASTLGAGRLDVFVSVTLPLMSPGIIAGILLGFARSLGEFGATITFVASIPGETRTLSLAIFALTQTPGGEAAALRLCLLSVVLALAALGASEWLSRRLARRLGMGHDRG
jgi:molybdate transport system permease protein